MLARNERWMFALLSPVLASAVLFGLLPSIFLFMLPLSVPALVTAVAGAAGAAWVPQRRLLRRLVYVVGVLSLLIYGTMLLEWAVLDRASR